MADSNFNTFLPEWNKELSATAEGEAPAALDMDALEQAIVASSEAVSSSNEVLQQELARLTTEGAASEETIARGTQAVNLQAQKAELQAQKARQEAFTAMGGFEQINKASAAYKQGFDTLLEEQQDVTDLESVTVADDGILNFVGAQLRLGAFEREEAQGAATRLNVLGNAISGMRQANTDAAKMADNVKSVRTEATIEAIEEAQKAEIAKAELEREKNTVKGYAKMVNDNYKLTRQQVADILAVKGERRLAETHTKQREKATIDKATDEALNKNVNVTLASLGRNSMTVAETKAMQKAGPKGQAQVEKLYLAGQSLQSVGAVGNDFYDAVNTLEEFSPAEVASNTAVNKFTQEVKERALAAAKKKGINLSDAKTVSDAEVARWINQTEEVYEKEQREEIPAGGAGLFSAMPYNVLANNVDIQKLPLHERVFKHLDFSKEAEPINEQEMWDFAAAAYFNKQITFNEWIDGIDTIFKFAGLNNNTVNQYERRNIANQTEYPTRLRLAVKGLERGEPRKLVNLMSSSEIRNAAVTFIARSTANAINKGESFLDSLGDETYVAGRKLGDSAARVAGTEEVQTNESEE